MATLVLRNVENVIREYFMTCVPKNVKEDLYVVTCAKNLALISAQDVNKCVKPHAFIKSVQWSVKIYVIIVLSHALTNVNTVSAQRCAMKSAINLYVMKAAMNS